MTRLLAAVTNHARHTIRALLEHVDAAWDCWGSDEPLEGPRSDERGPGCQRGATRTQRDETRETR